MMNLKKLNKEPKNPKHFLTLVFIETKRDPSIKKKNEYLKVEKDFGHIAKVKTAYGLFLISKDKRVLSKSFF